MMTVKELRLCLDDFSDNDLVEAFEMEETEDVGLFNILGIFRSILAPPGSLPEAGEPIGHISTSLSEVIMYSKEEDDVQGGANT